MNKFSSELTDATRRDHWKSSSRIMLIALLSLLTVLFFFGGPDYHSSRSFKAFWNIGHIIFYALLPLVIFTFPFKKQIRLVHQAVICLGLALILGLVVEFVQSEFQRTPDVGDLFRNFIGAFIGIFFLLPSHKTIPHRPLRFFQTATLILAATQIYPIAIALTDEYRANRQFPVLSDFETPYEIHRWRGDAQFSVDDTIAATGKHAMRICMNTDLYSGVSLHYFHENWTGYRWLQVLAYNPSPEKLAITCRIHDRLHTRGAQRYNDRYNQRFELIRGWNTIRIDLDHVKNAPRNRQMDMHHIYGIGFFATRLAHPRTIYIDDILLKK